MHLHPASRKEVRRIAVGTAVCDAVLLSVLFLLRLAGVGRFDYRVFIGVAGGSAVAIANFAAMCLTIQKATQITGQKAMKAFIQRSYTGRLLLQAAWVVAAIMLDPIDPIAGAAPLLFPNLVIFCLQSPLKGKTPGDLPGGFEA